MGKAPHMRNIFAIQAILLIECPARSHLADEANGLISAKSRLENLSIIYVIFRHSRSRTATRCGPEPGTMFSLTATSLIASKAVPRGDLVRLFENNSYVHLPGDMSDAKHHTLGIQGLHHITAELILTQPRPSGLRRKGPPAFRRTRYALDCGWRAPAGPPPLRALPVPRRAAGPARRNYRAPPHLPA